MRIIGSLIGYLVVACILALPAWLALKIGNVSFPFVSLVGLIMSYQLLSSFMFALHSVNKNKYKIIDLDKWN